MVSSGVWAGIIPLERAHGLQEVSESSAGKRITMKEGLQQIGYLGSEPISHKSMPMAAHFELHIEQGPILEAENRKVGIVKGAQAYRWFTVHVEGAASHTGTTPLQSRSDALLAASKMILYSHRSATKHNALVSTGIFNAFPGSTNTVPGLVSLSIDIRAPADSTVDMVEADLRESFQKIAEGENIDGLNTGGTPNKPCRLARFDEDSRSLATVFHDDCIRAVSDSAQGLFGADFEKLAKEMVSGAGHDSVQTNHICPTSMIFVPCRDGVSHNPKEYCSPEDCSIGAQVLLGAVLRYDQLRASKA
jgi:hydantoinase/carbamoylase family amidase